MYDRIFVPLDGSSHAARAIGVAALVAEQLDAVVHLLSVVPESAMSDMEEAVRSQAHAAGLEAPVITIEPSSAPVVERLLAMMREYPDALLCLSTTGRSHTGQLLGSVAEQLLGVVTGPFLLVGPECLPGVTTPEHTLIVPVDGSDVSEEVLPVAEGWASAMNCPVEVVEVISPEQAREVAGNTDIVETALVHRVADRLTKSLDTQVDWETLHGDKSADAIVQRARELGAGAIAMTTHGRTGLARLVMGSTAMAVVHEAPCPVLVHRPIRFR